MKLSVMRRISQRFAPPQSQEEARKIWEVLQGEGMEFSNFYQELEMSYPMAETHRDESYTNETLLLHSHSFYELLYCQSCDGVEYLVGSQRYKLQEGDIVIVSPGVSHMPLLPEKMKVPYRRDVLWLSKEFVEILPRLMPGFLLMLPASEATFLRTKGTSWESLGALFHKGVEEAESENPGWEGAVLGNTITIVSQIARGLAQAGVPQPKAEKPLLLDQVMAYIEQNMASKITLEDTARHFYVSVSTISQLFRQKLGVSFYRCVTQRRLIGAKQLIGEGTMLEEVSSRTGFADYSTFYRAFKKEYGITPRQYRKMLEATPTVELSKNIETSPPPEELQKHGHYGIL